MALSSEGRLRRGYRKYGKKCDGAERKMQAFGCCKLEEERSTNAGEENPSRKHHTSNTTSNAHEISALVLVRVFSRITPGTHSEKLTFGTAPNIVTPFNWADISRAC